MATRPSDLPSYDKPPVVEVALSVQFEALAGYRTVQAASLRRIFQAQYPKVAEQPPLEPAFETFGTHPRNAEGVRLHVRNAPQVPRLWFLNENESELIQFQEDRFVHNWRKTGAGTDYPRYEHIKDAFLAEWGKIRDHAKNEGLGEIKPNQCEVTYINHIVSEENINFHSKIGAAFTIWNDLSDKNFKYEIEDSRFSMRFIINGTDGSPIGRLHAKAEPAWLGGGLAGVVLTLTARGQPAENSVAAVSAFFDLGREQIVRGFTALTTEQMHRMWERTQ